MDKLYSLREPSNPSSPAIIPESTSPTKNNDPLFVSVAIEARIFPQLAEKETILSDFVTSVTASLSGKNITSQPPRQRLQTIFNELIERRSVVFNNEGTSLILSNISEGHINLDCDKGSLLLMSIGQSFGLKLTLVYIVPELSSFVIETDQEANTHTFLRLAIAPVSPK